METTDTRYEREREFHNVIFDEGTRKAVSKFYSINERSQGTYQRILRGLSTNRDVLEYGCGQGSAAFMLAKDGARVTGIDISDVAIDQARARAEREGISQQATFQVMNAEVLEFPPNSFDVICGSGILHHLDLQRAYAEVARTLRPGGSAIFIEPLGHNPLINWYRNRTPELRSEDEHPLLMDDLDLAGEYFGVVRRRYFCFASLAAVPLRNAPGFPFILGALDGFDSALFAAIPPARRMAWQVMLGVSQPRK